MIVLLRRLFTLEQFRTRSQRLGKIARISHWHVQYYTTNMRVIHLIDWPRARR